MNKKEYDRLYVKTKCKQILLILNKEKDADILAHLENIPNRSGYIKSLIRKQIKKEG